MQIKNINGTSQTTCQCGSWLNHWETFSGKTANYCQEVKCRNKDLIGAHVQKANSSDSKWYIIPLCNSHNQSKRELEVSSNTPLVSANKNETCEKP